MTVFINSSFQLDMAPPRPPLPVGTEAPMRPPLPAETDDEDEVFKSNSRHPIMVRNFMCRNFFYDISHHVNYF